MKTTIFWVTLNIPRITNNDKYGHHGHHDYHGHHDHHQDEDFDDFPILNHPYQRSTAVYNNLLLALFWFTKLTQGIANKKNTEL